MAFRVTAGWLVLLVSALLAPASCGGRSGLALPQPCEQLGEKRECENACGRGEQRCEGGYWHDCEVPRVTRTCSDACGTGIEACTVGIWQGCEVPVAERACTNVCGSGMQKCERGAWETACMISPIETPCFSACGAGVERCVDGRFFPCNAPPPKPPKLRTIVRDFRDTHPDFEIPLGGFDTSAGDQGMVEAVLGPDDKPVYASRTRTPSTSGKANFDTWYRDVPGVNTALPVSLQLLSSSAQGGLFVYSNRAFFPIDGQGFGNQGRDHNFHFTLEVATEFIYVGGETFSFMGDDDLWVFINRRLALDLGGLHQSLTGTIDLDRDAKKLGIAVGQKYALHLFFAERHTIESNFTVETSISDVPSCE